MAFGLGRFSSLAIRWRLTIWITTAFIATIVVIFIVLRVALGQILYRDVDSDLSDNFNHVLAGLLLNGAVDAPEISPVIQSFPFPVVIRAPDGALLAVNRAADPQEITLSEADTVRVTVERQTIDTPRDVNGEAFRIRSERAQIGELPRLLAQLGQVQVSFNVHVGQRFTAA